MLNVCNQFEQEGHDGPGVAHLSFLQCDSKIFPSFWPNMTHFHIRPRNLRGKHSKQV